MYCITKNKYLILEYKKSCFVEADVINRIRKTVKIFQGTMNKHIDPHGMHYCTMGCNTVP